MPWKPDDIDWLGLATTQSIEIAISELLSSNPVLNGRVTRSTAHPNLRVLFNSTSTVVFRGLQWMLNNPAPTTSRIVQHELVDQVTKHLIREHYLFKLTRPRPTISRITEGQLWFPASYYALRGNTIFDWKYGHPQDDFYDLGSGKRHPAVVAKVRVDGLYWAVPFSKSASGGKSAIPVQLRSGIQSYAKCSFPFLASWAMLEGDKNATNWEGLRLRTADFVVIQEACPRYYKVV